MFQNEVTPSLQMSGSGSGSGLRPWKDQFVSQRCKYLLCSELVLLQNHLDLVGFPAQLSHPVAVTVWFWFQFQLEPCKTQFGFLAQSQSIPSGSVSDSELVLP